MNKSITLWVVAAAALSIGSAAAAQKGGGGRPFNVTLTGAAERPGPGDPDGTGTAEIRVNPGQGRVCYTLKVSKIDPATAAHIHRAPPTEAGPVVVPLTAPTKGTSSGCAEVDRALAQEIIRNPSAFYVNVHNEPFKPGAVRGQLSR
jgi:hypothetical protein